MPKLKKKKKVTYVCRYEPLKNLKEWSLLKLVLDNF